MRRLAIVLVAGLVVLGSVAERGHAASKIRVVASLPDLKALTEAVGGDLVEVDVLARGDQNPHDIEIRPSLMVKLRRADLLIRNGVEGDPWVEPLLQGAGNGNLLPGTARPRRRLPGDLGVGDPPGPGRPLAGRRPPRGEPALHPGSGERLHRHRHDPGGARAARPRAAGHVRDATP